MKKNGFSLIKTIFVFLVIAFLIFLAMMFVARARKSNCGESDNSNVIFNNNMTYLQQAGTNFFTEDRLPQVVGENVKVTLAELIEQKYALEITDINGKACNAKKSYVSIIKNEKGYQIKTNLVCGKKSDYTLKELDVCSTICSLCTCNNKVVENEFMKKTTKTVTVKECPSGYKLSGSKCTLTTVETKDPTVKTTTTTDTKAANKVLISGTKTKVDTVVTTKKDTKEPTTEVVTPEKKENVYVEAIKVTEKVYTDPRKETKEECHDVTETKPGCTVQCKTEYQNGRPVTICNSCTITYKKCTEYNTWYCPNGYTSSGKDENTKCYKDVLKTSCPSTATHSSGSGETLKCWYVKTTPAVTKQTCTSGYKLENNKCVKYTKVYSCPSQANYKEGKDETLKCYVVTDGKFVYNCNGYEGYSLNGTNCVKTIVTKTDTCSAGYKLENKKCNKYTTTTKKATSKKVKKTSIEYKWSKETAIKGWTKTGKTRVVEDKNKACTK